MKRFLLILSALCIASVAFAQTSREEIDAHPHIAMATHSVYAGGYFFKSIAKAPKGYEPFYISHYGRHGSRYEAEAEHVSEFVEMFRTADKLGILTEKGKEVLSLAEWNAKAQEDMTGQLTPLGWEQHKAIARRMYERFKPVFQRGAIIDSRASIYPRCILSMAGFNESLKECQPMLETRLATGDRHQNVVRPIRSHTTDYTHRERKIVDHAWRTVLNKWAASMNFDNSLHRMFTDVEKLCSVLNMEKHDIAVFIYKRMAFVQNLGKSDRTLIDSIFSAAERHNVYLYENYRWYCLYTCSTLPDSGRYFAPMHYLVDDIVNYADLAIQGKNNASANLRFGHDYYLLGLLAVLNCNEIRTDHDISSVERLGETWKSYRCISMASNIQFVFYRSKKSSDILVRLLENENDITLPIPSVEGPFYKWESVRKYMHERADYFKNFRK